MNLSQEVANLEMSRTALATEVETLRRQMAVLQHENASLTERLNTACDERDDYMRRFSEVRAVVTQAGSTLVSGMKGIQGEQVQERTALPNHSLNGGEESVA